MFGDRLSQVLKSFCRHHPAAWGPFEKPDLHDVGLKHLFHRADVFGKGSSKRFYPDRSSGKLIDDGGQESAVGAIQSHGIHLKEGKRSRKDRFGYFPLSFHLGYIADTLEESEGNPRGSAAPARKFGQGSRVDRGRELFGSV